jgi:hypothetical protein
MRKDTTPRDMLLDRRVIERNIRKGLVNREEYEKSLAALPDVSEQAEEIRARLGVDDQPEPRHGAVIARPADNSADDEGDDGEDDEDDDGDAEDAGEPEQTG